MPINPMQRRARNSFFIGFLIALIIMAVVVALLAMKIKDLNENVEKLEKARSNVYVATRDLKSGEQIDFNEDFKKSLVITTVPKDTIVSAEDFVTVDSEGTETEKQISMKIDVPEGTIVTKNMIQDNEDPILQTQRIMQYNMIVLPSTLKNKDFIDIRISMPTGEDYIVLSKKEVYGTNLDSVWLKLAEEEIIELNNAIVEAYVIEGAKLYATAYIEAGMQNAAIKTYMPSPSVVSLIATNPNVVATAKEKILENFNATSSYRTLIFETQLDKVRDKINGMVQDQNESEIQKIKAERQKYIEELDGTDEIGYTN